MPDEDDQDRAGHLTIPSWALPVLLAFGSGGVGYLSHDAMAPDQEPAVLALRLQDLSDRFSVMSVKLDAMRVTLTEGTADRWRRTEHDQWERSELQPMLRELDQRIDALERRQTP